MPAQVGAHACCALLVGHGGVDCGAWALQHVFAVCLRCMASLTACSNCCLPSCLVWQCRTPLRPADMEGFIRAAAPHHRHQRPCLCEGCGVSSSSSSSLVWCVGFVGWKKAEMSARQQHRVVGVGAHQALLGVIACSSFLLCALQHSSEDTVYTKGALGSA